MLDAEHFENLIPRLMAADPALDHDTAGRLAAAVGDTPVIMDGQVVVRWDDRTWRLPLSVWEEETDDS